MHAYTHTQTCIHTCIHARIYTYICMYIHRCACIHTHIRIYTRAHTYTHIRMHTHARSRTIPHAHAHARANANPLSHLSAIITASALHNAPPINMRMLRSIMCLYHRYTLRTTRLWYMLRTPHSLETAWLTILVLRGSARLSRQLKALAPLAVARPS